MPYNLNHVHIRSLEPRKSAEWWIRAFRFVILDDSVRETGDRFIKCNAENGMRVNISSPRMGETLPEGSAAVSLGLEHFGFDVSDIDAEIERLADLGAPLLEGPNELPDGTRFCWVQAPDNVRVELIQWP